MPLQYVIDAYNTINHIQFRRILKKINPVRSPHQRCGSRLWQLTSNGVKDPQRALLEFIYNRRFGKNSQSKITVVFDGYPKVSAQNLAETDIDVIFSREETADARIKRMVEASKSPKNIVVVSDDREIIFFVKSVGASAIGVEEFIHPQVKPQRKKEELIKPELNFSQINKINQELKALWLKD